MYADTDNLKPLLISSGSTVGFCKDLLMFPDGRLAIEHVIEALHNTVPEAEAIYIAAHNKAQLDPIHFIIHEPGPLAHGFCADAELGNNKVAPVRIPIFDNRDDDDEIGGAAGLLAAHDMFPHASFLVLSCDYPLASPAALQQLLFEFVPPVTCFLKADGTAEPLAAIWGAEALARLKKNIEQGGMDMIDTIKELDGKMILSPKQQWLKGVNTRTEWNDVLELLTERQRHGIFRE